MINKKMNSDVLCLYIAILALIYAEFFTKYIYFNFELSYGVQTFCLKIYMYGIYQIFFFCFMKPIGAFFHKKNAQTIFKQQYIVYAVLAVYIIIVLLFEQDIIKAQMAHANFRFFSCILFGALGWYIGKVHNKETLL